MHNLQICHFHLTKMTSSRDEEEFKNQKAKTKQKFTKVSISKSHKISRKKSLKVFNMQKKKGATCAKA